MVNLENRNNMLLTDKEIAILSTILLESRSLPTSDVEHILKKMYIQCGHEEEKKIEVLIKNELFNYMPPQHGKNPAELLYRLIEAKRQSVITEIQYKKVGAERYQEGKLRQEAHFMNLGERIKMKNSIKKMLENYS